MMMSDDNIEEERIKDMQEQSEAERAEILEFNKQLLCKISTQLVASEIFRCQIGSADRDTIETDREDFTEMKELITVTRTTNGN